MEERTVRDDAGQERVSFAFFCSQGCLERSHAEGDEGLTSCDACATSFRVELASQVLFVERQRRYACSPSCRQQILAEARGVRLGELDDGPLEDTRIDGQLACLAPESDALPPVLQPPRDGQHGGQVVPLRPSAHETTQRTAKPAPEGPRVISVFNHKGGTGKTTTSVTLAAGLAERGAKVLLVDTDAQGNVGVSLGLTAERSLYHVLVMGLPIQDAVQHVRPGLDVLPANETLAAAELYLAGRRQRDRVLATRLQAARELYDYVIVDCSPSLSLMNQNALVMSDAVLCPVACDYLSLVGVRQVLKTIKHVNKLLGHPVRLWGVLPTFFDARARICHEALDTLREHFRDRCLEPVRAAIKVKEAPAQGKTLLEYASQASATVDYLKVVDRLLRETSPAAYGAANQAGDQTMNSAAAALPA
ncbi:MAG: ParA family protein [Polyangiaceae bacterium]|nr:ParA family protein [Polyangiaceae bacterium]MCW5791528.1 ParA family protein [Polyangiaceae bacterium]